MGKRIQIARLIAEAMADFFPQYERTEGVTRGYWYRRAPQKRLLKPEWFYRIVSIQSSQKWTCLEVDVYTGIFPLWDRQFGGHLLCRSTGLPNLRVGSSSILMDEVPYNHDGTETGASAALRTIVAELKKYATPWFEEAERQGRSDPLVKYGRRWIDDRLDEIPVDVMDQIEAAFAAADHKPWNVKYPLLTQLKDELRQIGADKKVSKWQREDISILALDLFRYAQQVKQGTEQPAAQVQSEGAPSD